MKTLVIIELERDGQRVHARFTFQPTGQKPLFAGVLTFYPAIWDEIKKALSRMGEVSVKEVDTESLWYTSDRLIEEGEEDGKAKNECG